MNPFVGLRPFREDERHLFTGREIASTYVETKSDLNPLLLLFARSGIGKSSFLTSRLIPELRSESSIIYVNEWGGRKPDVIVGDGLTQLASAKLPGRRGYLVLDQFEDVFKQDHDRRDLWNSLCEIANSDQTETRIIVTMREEWLGAWEEAEQYIAGAYNSMVRLAPLTKKELRRAIIRPIEIEGQIDIDHNVADILLQELRQPNAYGLGEGFVEPGLLQLVCQRLWEEAKKSKGRIDLALYDSLGGANAIIRDFVWQHFRSDSTSGPAFRSDQRVLWAGLVRHLAVAHGVKATVTPESLARKLLMADLGIAGPAIAAAKGLSIRDFLYRPVERRDESPDALIAWIWETLESAHSFGFLKRQEGFQVRNPRLRLYELSHDALDDVFRSFSLEFERWVTRRVYALWVLLMFVLFPIPFFLWTWYTDGFWNALREAATTVALFAVGAVVYAAVIWIMIKLFDYIAIVTYYPLVRYLVRGPIKRSDEPRGPMYTRILRVFDFLVSSRYKK
jgi:hypothetical protein